MALHSPRQLLSPYLYIPKYAEVKENHPNAKLEVWRTSSLKLDWELIEHSISQDSDGKYIATVSTESFSRHIYKSSWDVLYTSETPLFYIPFGIKERCQVFMSKAVQIERCCSSKFNIAVLFCPYKEESERIPHNYEYKLLDSGLLDFSVSNDDAVQFKFNQFSPNKHESIAGSFAISGRQWKSFTVELDREVELRGGARFGEISIGVKEYNYYTQTLMKVSIKPAYTSAIGVIIIIMCHIHSLLMRHLQYLKQLPFHPLPLLISLKKTSYKLR